jgi:hypothetical protein
MLLTHRIDIKCPSCGDDTAFGNVLVNGSELIRGCQTCGQFQHIPLPEVRKEVIYLDQPFLSHAFRQRDRRFVTAARKIRSLAARQQVVAPYSSIHIDETHLWSHSQKQQLFDFIKQTARGYQFNPAYRIQAAQIMRAFREFINKPVTGELPISPRDAFNESTHQWDSYFFVDLPPRVNNVTELKKAKKHAAGELVALFPNWRRQNQAFEDDCAEEARGYGRRLFNNYLSYVESLRRDPVAFLEAGQDEMIVDRMVRVDRAHLSITERINRVKQFLFSKDFLHTPYILESCKLFAVLRKLVRQGAFQNARAAQEKLAGVFFDIEAISTFGPYCNSIFVDRAMHDWCSDPDAQVLGQYGTRIFSVKNWTEFVEYLKELESSLDPIIKKYVDIAYP